MNLFTSHRERRYWLGTIAVVTAIYATLAQVPALARAVLDRNVVDQTFFNTFLVLVVSVLIVGLSKRPGWRELGVATAVLAVYVMALLRFTNPAERTHLFEYGVVAVLIYLALLERRQHRASVRSPAIVAFFSAAAIGWIDEGVQAILPNRFFDPIDLAFNTGAALGAVLTVKALRWARRTDRKKREATGGS